MDTTIIRTDAQGRQLNRFGEEVVACRTGCGRNTTMTGTRLCDACWEAEHRASLDGASPAATAVANAPAEPLKEAVVALIEEFGRARAENQGLRALVAEMQEALRCLNSAARGAAVVDADLIEGQCADYLADDLVDRYLQQRVAG